jgi:hypothetical protein
MYEDETVCFGEPNELLLVLKQRLEILKGKVTKIESQIQFLETILQLDSNRRNTNVR